MGRGGADVGDVLVGDHDALDDVPAGDDFLHGMEAAVVVATDGDVRRVVVMVMVLVVMVIFMMKVRMGRWVCHARGFGGG